MKVTEQRHTYQHHDAERWATSITGLAERMVALSLYDAQMKMMVGRATLGWDTNGYWSLIDMTLSVPDEGHAITKLLIEAMLSLVSTQAATALFIAHRDPQEFSWYKQQGFVPLLDRAASTATLVYDFTEDSHIVYPRTALPWTSVDDDQMQLLVTYGCAPSLIAAILKRHPNAIQDKLR